MISSSSTRCSSRSYISNLERFLQCVTPDVPSRTLHRRCSNDLNNQWLPPVKDTIEYFTLKDLWDCYSEWSAYGAGTPVMRESGETLMQFYVPYLSAIQIYSTKSVAASRGRREDNEVVELECDCWSDDSSDKLSRSLSNNSSESWDANSFNSSSDQVGSWPTRDMLGYLYLEYMEKSSPYNRLPLADKIIELARSYPALMTLKSVDLSPASWMAVSWYPIYAIPTQKDNKALATCFLTYHTLSSSFQDCDNICAEINIENDVCFPTGWGMVVGEKSKRKNSGCLSVSPFGLATYRMQGDIWLTPSSHVNERVTCLYNAANSWLKQLNVFHPDFNFFACRSSL
ncbi:hypothetical protein HN51_028378 [Arachis hypogaea]|uniref:DUF789 family protein n=1 Tax=Arachis hypogaea TaxID=3818 RepID=A0A445BJA8_ARAHY|nr:uncharacterized protein LOC112711067 [Arachis hypogaea]QHO34883.1 uncharacterized protein DS421_9g270830 [Arachis hypogaea]RYR38681.1 hypothetical protein Ahy_A09g043822 isoform B [Arachis hypogaea]